MEEGSLGAVGKERGRMRTTFYRDDAKVVRYVEFGKEETTGWLKIGLSKSSVGLADEVVIFSSPEGILDLGMKIKSLFDEALEAYGENLLAEKEAKDDDRDKETNSRN